MSSPCKYCVAPKRYPGCHSTCKEYKDWNAEHQQLLAKKYEANRANDDCFPNRLRNGRGWRKRANK